MQCESLENVGDSSEIVVTDLATRWRDHLADADTGGPVPLEVPLDTVLKPLAGAVWDCAMARAIPPRFQAETRTPLGAYLAAFRKADRDEAEVSEGIALLGDLIEDRIRIGDTPLHIAARRLGVALDAVQLLVRHSEWTMRSWRNRRSAEAASSTATFAEVLGSELASRLGAAVSALDLLDSTALSPDERETLEAALTKSIRAARICADDLMLISPSPTDADTPVLPLDELVYSTVGRLNDWASARDVTLSITRPPPSVRIDARPFQALLFNLITVAVHRAEEVSGPVVINIDLRLDPTETQTELALSSDAPLFASGWDRAAETAERLDLESGATHMEDLSLWLTAESSDQLGGRMEIFGEADHLRGLKILFPVGARPT